MGTPDHWGDFGVFEDGWIPNSSRMKHTCETLNDFYNQNHCSLNIQVGKGMPAYSKDWEVVTNDGWYINLFICF